MIVPDSTEEEAEDARLARSAVTLWYTPFGAVAGPGLIDRYRGLLNAQERARERSFYFSEDRKRHVIAHALLRMVLSKESGGAVAPQHWEFTVGSFGKPSLTGTFASSLSFNLTHADGLAAVAVTREGGIGVDAERISGNSATQSDWRGLFSPHEAAAIEALPPAERAARFLEYWTLKEAWVKAVGGGLTFPFERPAFCFTAEQSMELCVEQEKQAERLRWKFWQLRIPEDFVVAVCVERTTPDPPRLRVREIIPLVSERVVPCRPQRESH